MVAITSRVAESFASHSYRAGADARAAENLPFSALDRRKQAPGNSGIGPIADTGKTAALQPGSDSENNSVGVPEILASRPRPERGLAVEINAHSRQPDLKCAPAQSSCNILGDEEHKGASRADALSSKKSPR
jgi:hypothetical protein